MDTSSRHLAHAPYLKLHKSVGKIVTGPKVHDLQKGFTLMRSGKDARIRSTGSTAWNVY